MVQGRRCEAQDGPPLVLHPCHAGAWGPCWSSHSREGQAVHAGDITTRQFCLRRRCKLPYLPRLHSVCVASFWKLIPPEGLWGLYERWRPHSCKLSAGADWVNAARWYCMWCIRVLLHPGTCWHVSLRNTLRGALHAQHKFHAQVAEELTHTCWQMYHQMPTGLHAPPALKDCLQRKTACDVS